MVAPRLRTTNPSAILSISASMWELRSTVFPASRRPQKTSRTALVLHSVSAGGNGRDFRPRVLAAARDLLFDPGLLRHRPGSYSAGNVRKFAYLQNLGTAIRGVK